MAGGPILEAVGLGLDLYGKLESAKSQSAALQDEAAQARANAVSALRTARATADQHAIQAQMAIAGEKADYAASGLEGGSVDAVIQNSAINAEMDRLNIQFGGDIKSKNFMSQAQRQINASNDIRKAGLFGVAASLFSGAGKVAKYTGSGSGSSDSYSINDVPDSGSVNG